MVVVVVVIRRIRLSTAKVLQFSPGMSSWDKGDRLPVERKSFPLGSALPFFWGQANLKRPLCFEILPDLSFVPFAFHPDQWKNRLEWWGVILEADFKSVTHISAQMVHGEMKENQIIDLQCHREGDFIRLTTPTPPFPEGFFPIMSSVCAQGVFNM